ncbi:MAG: 50S ribosomal protein L29, partial [Candidatus Acidiferrum sp.]
RVTRPCDAAMAKVTTYILSVFHACREPLIMPRRIDKIREAGVNELEAQLKELTEQIFRLKFQLSTGQAEALKRLRESKKDLARVKTLLRAQELAAAAKPQAAGKA